MSYAWKKFSNLEARLAQWVAYTSGACKSSFIFGQPERALVKGQNMSKMWDVWWYANNCTIQVHFRYGKVRKRAKIRNRYNQAPSFVAPHWRTQKILSEGLLNFFFQEMKSIFGMFMESWKLRVSCKVHEQTKNWIYCLKKKEKEIQEPAPLLDFFCSGIQFYLLLSPIISMLYLLVISWFICSMRWCIEW